SRAVATSPVLPRRERARSPRGRQSLRPCPVVGPDRRSEVGPRGVPEVVVTALGSAGSPDDGESSAIACRAPEFLDAMRQDDAPHVAAGRPAVDETAS